MIRWLLYLPSIFLNWIPKRVVGQFADFLGLLFYHTIAFRRGVIEENLRTAYKGNLSDSEVQAIVLKNYQHYARIFFEIIQSIVWTKDDYRKNVKIHGKENIEPALKSGRGAFILTSHLGNWEFPIGSVSADGIPIDIVVKKSQTQIVEAFLQWYRRKNGAGIYHESETAKDILRSLNKGRFVGVILDQFMGPPIGLPVRFFGELAGTAVGLALLTEKKDVPVISAYNFRDEDGSVHIVFNSPLNLVGLSEDKVERLYQKTQMFNDAIENDIRKHPEQWLWLHRRWKSYRGEPRWKLSKNLVSLIFAIFFQILVVGCSSTGATPTGIALPNDPNIAVPKFDEKNVDELSLEKPKEVIAPQSKSTSLEAVIGNKRDGKKRGKKETSQVNTETKTPAAAEQSVQKSEPFTVVPVDRIPFEVGERLEIDLGWTALPAGKAVLEVREGQPFNGRETFHLWGNVLSSKIVDAVYHVDNTIESYVDKRGVIPYKFLLHMVESKQLKETRVSFDHPNSKSFYWAKRISERWGNQDIDRQDALVPSARDMFSALYYARTINYQMGKKTSFTIYENGQNWNVELVPVAYELVNSGVGAFQCWKILVTVKLNNVLSPTGDLYLWLSDDSKKYPVKFDAKIKIGSMVGNLTKIRER